jgi:hypothetical protein
MSVTLLGSLLLAVSILSVIIYMAALGQLLIGPHRPGLARTALCRIVAALLYVGVALLTLQTNTQGPLVGLGVFTVVQLMWQANAVADVRLTRHGRSTVDESYGVRPPTPNYIAPLGDAVVAAEIDRLSDVTNAVRQDMTNIAGQFDKFVSSRRYMFAFIGVSVAIGIAGLIFGLVTYNRSDEGLRLAQQNAAIVQDLRATQARLDVTVHQFCGLYDSFLGFYSPQARAIFPEGPQAYDRLFNTLLAESNNLQCNLRKPAGLGG